MKISPAIYPHSGVSVGDVYREKCVGLELRDYFAAHAMSSILAHLENHMEKHLDLHDEDIAKFAYRQADAMLEERER